MENNINTNVADTLTIGKEAARFWGLSVKHGESGDANAIVALVHAQRFVTFTATVERKKEETDETFDFDVLSLVDSYWNNDGSKDIRKMSARTATLAKRLFGIEELNNAIKTRLARCIRVAVYLLNSLSALTDEQLVEAVRLEKGKLVVPYGLVAPEPGEDASAKEKAVYQSMRNESIALDGKEGMSIAELSRRANPPKSNRAASNDKTSGASFTASLDMVIAVVSQQLNEDAPETDVGLSNELRRKLFALSQSIASYFQLDPLEDDEMQPEAVAA